MKYLKHFESKSDKMDNYIGENIESVRWDPHEDPQIKIHLDIIRDLFFDVVDEFDLYKRTDIGEVINFYDIFHWEYYSAKNSYADNKFLYKSFGSKKIRLIVKYKYADKESKIRKSKSFLGFIDRLKSLGYDIIRWSEEYIGYDIDYSNLI